MNEHEITKKWLKDNPYKDELPKGWEIRFGIRGRFMKYDSIEHIERKNMFRSNYQWEAVKANYREGDELWLVGNDGLMIYLIRDGQIAYDYYGKYKSPKNGFHVMLGYC